jgi:hypothetical protein
MRALGAFTPYNSGPPALGEDEPYGFDFRYDLLAGESITSVEWTLTVSSGTDAAAQSHLGENALSGTIATTEVSGLLPNVVYILTAWATLNVMIGPRYKVIDLWSYIISAAPGARLPTPR